MKNAAIFHGTGGTPNHFWHPYVKQELEKLGYEVWLPQLPNTDKPDVAEWLPFVLNNKQFNEETVLIGHSAGCPLILSILEKGDVKIRLAIMVAAFYQNLDNIDKEPILQDTYDWEKIKAHCSHSVIINSDNDPWGCNDKVGQSLFEKIGGDLIIRHGQGHMGSEKFNQPYKEFPLLVNLVRTFEEKT